jgi:hypothetical protein
MADEPQLHDLTKFLLSRLNAYPEEFSPRKVSNRRWHKAIEVVREHGAKEDKDALNEVLHKFHMDDAWQAVMEALLAPPDPPEKKRGKKVFDPISPAGGGPISPEALTREMVHELNEQMRNWEVKP